MSHIEGTKVDTYLPDKPELFVPRNACSLLCFILILRCIYSSLY